jgi:hypothetical protein
MGGGGGGGGGGGEELLSTSSSSSSWSRGGRAPIYRAKRDQETGVPVFMVRGEVKEKETVHSTHTRWRRRMMMIQGY